jgi:hypothetical protein
LALYIQTKTMAAQLVEGCKGKSFLKAPMMPATMKWQEAILIAPTIRMLLRPKRSTHRTAGIVKRNSRQPTTPVASKEVVVPSKPRSSKMKGLNCGG